MSIDDHYSIDTSALIDWWVRYYPPSAFAGLLPRIEQLISDGRLRASREVQVELKRQDDDCFKWAKRQINFFAESDAAIQVIVSDLMATYFNPAKPEKGIGDADPFVIGLAAVQSPRPWVVVTGEKPGSLENPKMPWVFKHFKPQPIRTIGFLEFIVEEGWQLV